MIFNSRPSLGGALRLARIERNRPFDLTRWPALRDHVEERLWQRGHFSIFEDLDVEIRDPVMARSIAAQAVAYWHRDAQSLAPLGPARIGSEPSTAGAGAQMRHASSLPWEDGRGLERWIAAMIDAARQDITIVSEFFYPPDRILDALLRAEARGVRVRILLQLGSLEPSDAAVRHLNTLSVSRWGDRFESFAYRGAAQWLHGKILVIEGALSLLGSSNLNQRSYLHDSETVLKVLDRGGARQVLNHADNLISSAEPIPLGQPTPRLGELIEPWPWAVGVF